jgi:tetratricopeptide (TPR) repeat protein
MLSDSVKVSRYARESIRLAPEKKDCQWLLDKAEGAATWDWNVDNHAKVIDFYKEIIANDSGEPKAPLPYYYLIDNLIADHRTVEARAYMEAVAKLPTHRPQLIAVYRARIALSEFDGKTADVLMEAAEKEFPNDGIVLFEKAQYHAIKCEYDKAIEYYEKSFANDKQPRFIDALQGIAIIQEIQGNYGEAATAYDRIIECQKTEWGLTEETELKESEAERQRLLELAAKKRQ